MPKQQPPPQQVPATPQATQQNILLSWNQVGAVIGGIAISFWAVFSVVNQDIRARLLSIDNSISQINITLRSHGESLVGIDAKMKELDRRVAILEKPHYESKAKAAGFKNPQIVPIGLTAEEKFDSKPLEAGAEKHFLRYIFYGYDLTSEKLQVRVDMIHRTADGKERLFWSKPKFYALRIRPGETHELRGVIGERPTPSIFVQVIDHPSPDRAVLAIGEKVDRGGNSS